MTSSDRIGQRTGRADGGPGVDPPPSAETPATAARERRGLRRGLLTPAVWAFYLLIVLEFLFMISPFALYFYSSYGPVLNVFHHSRATAWLTGFFLPHFSITSSPWLNALKPLGFLIALAGLLLFFWGAVQIYWSKLVRRGAVTGGLYRFIRHPQYLALAILGLGVLLVWPRFLVLATYVTMLFLYAALAGWEEERCLQRYGDSYRAYLERTGRFVPRALSSWLPRLPDGGRRRAVAALGLFVLSLAAALALGFGLRRYSLSRVSGFYEQDVAVLSPAVLGADQLDAAYRIAARHPAVTERLGEPGLKLLVYVVPAEWYLPDLPIHPIEEILRERRGGHSTPADFDRDRYRLLFTAARSFAPDPRGRDIVLGSYAREPLALVQVDLGRGEVTAIETPPPHVVWGEIPTPAF